MKKQKSAGRSALGLMASGVATIKLGQTMPRYRLLSERGAAKHDSDAISRDARRALTKTGDHEYA